MEKNADPANWPLWEVFIRARQGLDHKHAGSLHAADAQMALENARDVYTRRNEGISIWVVESRHIHASSPEEAGAFFDPADDKPYRYPDFYRLPDEFEKYLTGAMDPLVSYIIQLADNALILGHRNSEWTGHGPILEQDIALSNIALDLIGQSRNFYQLAAKKINASSPREKQVTEDDLAYLRDAPEFKNAVLLEQPNGDWAQTMLRQFYFSHFQWLQYGLLLRSNDAGVAAIAEKSMKETRYHVKWSSEWICRLGDGTAESHARILRAAEILDPLVPELFVAARDEKIVARTGGGVDPAGLRQPWLAAVNRVLEAATLPPYPADQKESVLLSGKNGIHSEHLGYILAEMQFLQRAYPGCEW